MRYLKPEQPPPTTATRRPVGIGVCCDKISFTLMMATGVNSTILTLQSCALQARLRAINPKVLYQIRAKCADISLYRFRTNKSETSGRPKAVQPETFPSTLLNSHETYHYTDSR